MTGTPAATAATPPRRGLMWLGIVYLIVVLAATLLINVVALRDPANGNLTLPLFALVLTPLWIFLIRGLMARLHGQAQAPLLPRAIVRALHLVFGLQAIVTGVLGVTQLIRFSTKGEAAIYVAPIVILIGCLFLYRFMRGAKIRWR